MKNTFLTSLIILTLAGPLTATTGKVVVVNGTVAAVDGTPVMGAAVSLIARDTYLAGMATDIQGRFGLKTSFSDGDTLFLSVSAIGFEGKSISFFADKDTLNFDIILIDKPLDYGTIEVLSRPWMPGQGQSLTSEQVAEAARHSLITTNPVSAIRQPQTVREGSAHSSKIRVNGTSPVYFMNGIEMGRDPNHYGMFSIVPGSVVERLNFIPQGTGAEFGSPSIIEFETAEPFGEKPLFETDLSFVEGTGIAALAGGGYYLLGSLRYSVLDLIADKITRDSDQSPIPPTSFRDIYASGGLRILSGTKMFFDHYQVRDFLSYDLSSTAGNPGGVSIKQDTGERYIGLRMESVLGRLRLKLGSAVKESREEYQANSKSGENYDLFSVNLQAQSREILGDIKGTLSWNAGGMAFGSGVKSVSGREITLRQNNWNFLPPDAPSDEPYVFYRDLNLLYGSYRGQDDELDGAAYFSAWRSLGNFRLETGMRVEYFSRLAARRAVLYRQSLEYVSGVGRLRLSYGTYADNPLGKILEPYQVIVHADLNRLRPVKTELTAMSYSLGPLTFGAFNKVIDRLPRITPDFNFLGDDGLPQDGFITMRPEGALRAFGGDITFEPDRLLHGRFGFRASYGYTHAGKFTAGIKVPYELNAPHKFSLETDYRIVRRLTLGGSLAVRSGYPYTRTAGAYAVTGREKYRSEYYHSVLENENSESFPANFISNVYLDLDLGRLQAYFTLCNISNYKNPIIRTNDGYIYDSGILPSLGIKLSF